ncbi:hypothetical protein D3C86_2074150 [compost metagenome]
MHLIAGFRRAVGNRDALAQIGRTLGFARLHPGQVTGRDQIIAHQTIGKQRQRRRFIRGAMAHLDLRDIQLEH